MCGLDLFSFYCGKLAVCLNDIMVLNTHYVINVCLNDIMDNGKSILTIHFYCHIQ